MHPAVSPEQMIQDGVAAATLVADVSKLLKPLITSLRAAGAEVQHPELRLKCPDERMEYSAGLELKHRLIGGNQVKIKIPPPEKFRLYSLVPYRPLDEAATITPDGISIERSALESYGDNFRVELTYPLEGRRAITSLVYTSSPAESLVDESENEITRYWLHSELKTLSFLKELYRYVRIEDVDVQVDVTVRDDIKTAITPELRFEIGMMAKLASRDRNEARKALAYKSKHLLPKFRGDIFQTMQDVQEIFQPSKFRRFLSLQGPYRLSNCYRGTTLADLCLPLYLPQSMVVYSSTDLTLDEPAKEGKLVYRKSELAKRLAKILEQ